MVTIKIFFLAIIEIPFIPTYRIDLTLIVGASHAPCQ